MAYLLGSASTASYTTSTAYTSNENYAQFNGNNTEGVAAASSGVGAKLNLYIAAWNTISSIRACLYEDNILLATKIINSTDGTGLVSVVFPNTTITAGTQRYRLAFYVNTTGTINLFTKAGALTSRKIASGTYTSPVGTLPSGTFVTTAEFYWSIETAPAYSIDVIDSDNTVEVGQSFTINTTGFTGQPTGVTNNANVNVTVTGGSANAWTATVTDRQNGVTLDALPTGAIQLTLTNPSLPTETAQRSFTLTKKAADILATFSGANTTDPTYLTYYLSSFGYTVEGGMVWYVVPIGMDDLVVDSSGLVETSNLGTFTMWFRPITGTGSGKYYYFDVTVTEAGVVGAEEGVVGAEEGLTTKSLTGGYLIGQFLVGSTL